MERHIRRFGSQLDRGLVAQAISTDRWRRVLKIGARSYFLTAAVCAIPWILPASKLAAQDAHFHNAPPSSVQLKNPYAGQHAAVVAGSRLYTTNCGSCHGIGGRGTGNIPALSQGPTQAASDGEVFWFITTGSVNNGMPAWGSLPEQKRWQIVTYLKSLKNSPSAQKTESASANTKPVKTNAPPPQPPYTDFRFEEPGKVRKITAQDLPAPYSSDSAGNAPKVVPRPQGAWPKAPAGFSVQQYATGLDNPRLIRTAPNGDVFLAESSSGKIRVFRGITREGKPEEDEHFCHRTQSALWHRLLSSRRQSAMDIRRQHRLSGPVSVSEWRTESNRPPSAYCRPPTRRRALDPRRAVHGRRQEDVCCRRIVVECRRSRHHSG